MTLDRRTFLGYSASAWAALAIFALSGPAAASGGIYNSWGKAIRGYDPVAYFTEGRPVEGSGDYTHDYMGADWRFATAENQALFAADPEKYAPQYGGYCAWAVSEGYTASIDPEAWRIVDGKLYLNYSKSVQADWIKDIPGHIKKADANWPGLRQGLVEEEDYKG